ncbi:hypothetical protein KSF_060530 [Reticulibacter mediterranei]|uniref:DUF4388 domain-containing protein n=1 Tax=Reticulibacter mediterranei TaxID=2778369 RepID=A0A8J3IPB1_9CHLR|nr:DUF4388 domain-containing protein [Reticulibacter mediterranei]GHO96005.1 hypothetical protein KSF_060530 [Reticulibacter mediterranei]
MQTNNFASLLQHLNLSQQSGTLIVSRQGEAWQARLHLRNGKWLDCSLLSGRNGRMLLDGEQVVYWLSQKGTLEWQLVDQQSHDRSNQEQDNQQEHFVKPPASVKSNVRLIPRRLTPTLSQKHAREVRHIFHLIDGKRSLEDVARLLHKPYEEVVRIAQMLVAEGIVTINHD